MLRNVSLACSSAVSASLCKKSKPAWSLLSAARFSDKKKGDDLETDLQKDLKKLNEILKSGINETESPVQKQEQPAVDKNFMNFRKQAEQEAFNRSSNMFSWKVALATLAVGGSCLAALFYVKKIRLDEREKHRKQVAGKARIGGEWELVNTDGKLEGSQELRGNWLLMYFGFTHCPDICPDEIEKMVKVVKIIESKKEATPIVPVFISVDPERDTIARVKEYCAEFSSKLRGFTGTTEQVNKVAKTFRVYHSQGPRTNKQEDDYIVDHTVIMYLIDPDGQFYDYYGQNRQAEEIANVIQMKVLNKMAAKPDDVKNEFSVRIAKQSGDTRYSVMMFNGMDKVETSKWTMDSNVTMEREDNRGVVLATQTVQEYGEGSEYGRAAREEARRKKFGRQSKSYKLDNQPWRLAFKEPKGRVRQMRGIREGGANEHADYWVFLKPTQSSEFKAYKVDEWHKFLPAITHKTLDIDQAEEQFSQRNKVMNQFALKAAIQNQLNAADETELTEQQKRLLKIKDEGSSDDSEDGDDEGEGEEGKKKNKKKKKNLKPTKEKRQRVENSDEVAKYESSDGEDEGREYDYISDSGTDSDREQVPSDEKIEKQLVGVAEEEGAREHFDSDSSESDDDLAKKLKPDGEKKKSNDIEERDSSGSDTDDPDNEKIDSVVFLPKKEAKEGESSKKRAATDDAALKNDELGPSDPKKAKTGAKFEEGLNEETVRRYLRRKPHTTKELLQKMTGKCEGMNKSEMVTRLAAILKAIEPHQSKQLKGKKEVLFFSLTNTVA
uniref:Transcription initiation factor IIF subunit alpha n=1 Tax=Caenorhabditis japonica TaxID=281687 RepID=A0A8R1DEP6_CAEJA